MGVDLATINLTCSSGHDFEAWFRSPSDFEKQREALLVSCPWCGDDVIERRLSVPNVISASRRKTSRTLAALEVARKACKDAELKSNCDKDNCNSDLQNHDSFSDASSSMVAFAKELRNLHAFVEENCDDVGDRFAEEARRRHEEKFLAELENCNGKQTNSRGIRGKASIDEVRSLHEEGIEIAALPPLPSSYN